MSTPVLAAEMTVGAIRFSVLQKPCNSRSLGCDCGWASAGPVLNRPRLRPMSTPWPMPWAIFCSTLRKPCISRVAGL